MTRVWGVLLVVVVAASGCPPMQNVPSDGNDPSVAYLREEVDEMHEKLAKQTDANTRFAGEVQQLRDTVGTESGRITRVDQRVTSIRDDFTYSFNKAGRHTLKVGGEYFHQSVYSYISRTSIGVLDAQGVADRKQARSKYGAQRKKAAAPGAAKKK